MIEDCVSAFQLKNFFYFCLRKCIKKSFGDLCQARSQLGFIDFIVRPTFEQYAQICPELVHVPVIPRRPSSSSSTTSNLSTVAEVGNEDEKSLGQSDVTSVSSPLSSCSPSTSVSSSSSSSSAQHHQSATCMSNLTANRQYFQQVLDYRSSLQLQSSTHPLLLAMRRQIDEQWWVKRNWISIVVLSPSYCCSMCAVCFQPCSCPIFLLLNFWKMKIHWHIVLTGFYDFISKMYWPKSSLPPPAHFISFSVSFLHECFSAKPVDAKQKPPVQIIEL